MDDTRLAAIRRAFEETLAAALRLSPDWGFEGPAFDVREGLLPALNARYRSPTRTLVLSLVFDSSQVPDAPPRHVMTVHLYRNDGEDQDDRLSADWFATLHRGDLEAQLDRAANSGGSLEQFVRTVIPIYRRLFEEDMAALLAGTAWESGAGDPSVVRKFAFLERDFGFSRPKGRHYGHDLTHTYTRGDVSINVTWDGGPHEVMSIAVGALPMQFIWQTPPERVIAVLQAHPEIFDGDFRALAGIAVSG